jgi:formylglycine-generating enzyme required for sulfatase activity
MNNMGKPKIFISYSRKDSEIAERVYKDLKNEGFAPWLDTESLLPGQNWKMMISKEMKESSFFLALLSSDSLGKRGYVNKELKFALDILDEFPLDEIYLIPVYIDPCEPLDERLRDIHGIHLYESYERGVKKLIHALNHYTKSSSGNKTDSSSIDEKEQLEIRERIKGLKKNYDILSLDNTLRERTIKEKLNIQKLLGREYMKLKEYEKADQAFRTARALSQEIDTLEYEKSKKAAPARTAETRKPAIRQTLDIDTLLAQAEAEKIRKKEMLQKLEQALEKYDLLLKNHGSQYKDQAWQAICSDFPMFTQGVLPGDTLKLKIKDGLKLKVGASGTEPLTGMEFIWVPPGCYMMGSDSGGDNGKPVHEVCLDSFWIGKYQLTQGQYKKIIGSNPSHFKSGDDYPVECVSWEDAQKFILELNQQSGKKFSLPTEAQWEYAARRGGQGQVYAGGDDVERFAWYKLNSGGKTHAVGTKEPNELGIYDMSGNVWEWCEDVYDKKAYEKHERNNPVITSGSTYCVFRGGCWGNSPRIVRAANRLWGIADNRVNYVGFRLCLSQVRQQETGN